MKNPELLSQTFPEMPFELVGRVKEAGLQLVIVAVFITDEGAIDPTRFLFIRCPHALLGRATLESILQSWRFEPGRVGGTPVEVFATVEFQFSALADR